MHRVWPAPVQTVSLSCGHHNVPQFLHCLSPSDILPNLVSIPYIDVDREIDDEEPRMTEWTVSRWMVDQAAEDLSRRGGTANLRVAKPQLYDPSTNTKETLWKLAMGGARSDRNLEISQSKHSTHRRDSDG